MTRYVALLRGVNLGGHNAVAMPDLRDLVAGLGHTDVSTYINSGNVVFTGGTPQLDQVGMAEAIRAALKQQLGLDVAVMVRSEDEVAEVLRSNPFPDAVPNRLLITFLDAVPDTAAIERANAVESGRDEFRVIGTVLYLHCPDGIGRSKLAAASDSRLGVVGTARNLRTVRKLLEMARR